MALHDVFDFIRNRSKTFFGIALAYLFFIDYVVNYPVYDSEGILTYSTSGDSWIIELPKTLAVYSSLIQLFIASFLLYFEDGISPLKLLSKATLKMMFVQIIPFFWIFWTLLGIIKFIVAKEFLKYIGVEVVQY